METNDECIDIHLITHNQRAGIPNIKDLKANDFDPEDHDECSSDTKACYLRMLTPTNLDSKKRVR